MASRAKPQVQDSNRTAAESKAIAATLPNQPEASKPNDDGAPQQPSQGKPIPRNAAARPTSAPNANTRRRHGAVKKQSEGGRKIGTYGTGMFRSTSKRFQDDRPITANVDSAPPEVLSTVGKHGPKISFTKASDRFTTSPPPTANVTTYFYKPTMLNRSGSSLDSPYSHHADDAVGGATLVGGGERFDTKAAVTANVPFYCAHNPGGLASSNNKPSSTIGGRIMTTGPRFSQRARVPKSSTTDYEEVRAKQDFYVPPGMGDVRPKSGGRVVGNAKRFVDPVTFTQNVDFHQPSVEVSTLATVKAVPASASLRSATPRFEGKKPVHQADFFVPRSFVDEILQK